MCSSLLAAVVLVVAPACTGDDEVGEDTTTTAAEEESSAAAEQTTADLLAVYGDTRTLATLLQGTDLVTELSGEGPVTVFAPTDAALAELGEEGLAALQEDPGLEGVLGALVVPADLDAVALTAAVGTSVETLAGPVPVELDGSTLVVGGARVTGTDIVTSNGVVHLVDALVVPAQAG